MKGVFKYSHSLEKVQGIIAPLLKMVVSSMVAKAKLSSPEFRQTEITKEIRESINYKRAMNVVFFTTMDETYNAVLKGKPVQMDAYKL